MKRFLIILALSALGALSLSGCALVDSIKDYANSFKEQKLPMQNVTLETKNEKVQLTVEIPDSSDERAQGLMYRPKLKDGRGMLFIFDDEAYRSFWMFNTTIPLDAIFFDKNRTVVEVIQMEPCKSIQCPKYSPNNKAKYVLEVNKGFSDNNNINNDTFFILN